MRKTLNNFLLMVQFFTRIKVNRNLACDNNNFKWGSVFMPVIGLIIGGVQWIAYKLSIYVLPINISILIAILAGIILTGAMHIDGLGDTCDGFFAFKGRDNIVGIMKDSRIGTYSCIAIIMDILFKYNLLYFIAARFSLAIIVAPVISRLSTVFIISIGKTAKKTGTANLFIGNVKLTQFMISAVITVIILLFLINMNPRYSFILMLASIITSLLFNLYSNNKIGGLTGDLLGANNEIVEIMILILICIIIK